MNLVRGKQERKGKAHLFSIGILILPLPGLPRPPLKDGFGTDSGRCLDVPGVNFNAVRMSFEVSTGGNVINSWVK